MSTKSTIFLTGDNEHCYEDTNDPRYRDGEWIGDVLTLEMSKANIKVVENTDHDLIVEILPGSELYDLIKSLKK